MILVGYWGQQIRVCDSSHLENKIIGILLATITCIIVDCRILDKFSHTMKLSVGYFSRAYHFTNLIRKSLGPIAHMLLFQGFLFDN